ncbi:hypothetical protein SAMN05444162_3586 [Paenibacillaceae bacterium GAS479]|nr:hypothetical protein SAMN05444162_3586 [Paenibacillaceae bacterium GAS479]
MDLKAVVAVMLRQEFPEYLVLTAGSDAGATPGTPYMELTELSGYRQSMLGRRYRQRAALLLRCVPAASGSSAALLQRLYLVLASFALPAGGWLKGSGMSHELVDGVLIFKWNTAYEGLETQAEPPLMQKLNEEVGIDETK